MSEILPEYVTLAEGGRVSVELEGVVLGGLRLARAHVRQLSAGDILDAQEEAERLVYAADGGMALVMSPARMARAALRRQVARLAAKEGDQEHHGPLSAEELNAFSLADLDRLQAAAALLDKAAVLGGRGQAVEARGRTDAGGGEHAPAAGTAGPQSGN